MQRKFVLSALVVVVLTAVVVAQDHGVQAVIGNVFLQNTTPGQSQIGHATITGTFRAGQVFVQQGSTATIPVVGNNNAATGNTHGGSFSVASPTGTAIRGTATSMTGSAVGVFGDARSVNGIGVHGKTNGGIGVFATANTGVAVSGTSNEGNALVGLTNSGVAVLGINEAPDVPAILGVNKATTGQAAGGSFGTTSTAGQAVRAVATRTTGFAKGVFGESKSKINGEGVHGLAASSGAGFGVHGQCASANGFGVFCEGNQAATGTKSFIIDHPLDPENRYLKHYCAEGSEPRNVYMGHITTDAQGYAWVTLPDYYDSINVNPEYQLTVLDGSEDFVLAKVTKKVAGHRFQIRTSKPRVEVSWRIDAVRNDRWLQQNGYSAEPTKPQVFRGTYLNPELYGQSPARAQTRPTGDAISQPLGSVLGSRS